jgi:hypothetical protein
MFKTVWVCQEKRIQLYAGVDIWLDKALADKYSSTFTQLDPQPESTQNEPITITISEARQLPVPVEDLNELQFKAELENKEIIHGQALVKNMEIDHGEAILENKESETDEVKADAKAYTEANKANLIKTIDGFSVKKELDVYAKKLGVKLDGRKTIKKMSLKLKKELNLI